MALASRYAVPAIYAWHDFAAAGGLISYGANTPSVYYQGGILVGKILKGAKPADLPVQQPTRSSWSSTSKLRRRSASLCRR